MDITKPSAEAVMQLDGYFQYHPLNEVLVSGDRIADRHYPKYQSDINGWLDPKISDKVITTVYRAFRILQMQHDITDEMVLNDEY